MDKTRPEHRPAPAVDSGAHLALYLILCGEQPTLGGMGFDLAGARDVVIGRGAPLGATSGGDGRARIDVPDPTMSASTRASPSARGRRASRISDPATGLVRSASPCRRRCCAIGTG